MNVVVLGAGFQGAACVFDLIQSPHVDQVILVDQSPQALEQAKCRLQSEKLVIQQADITQIESAIACMEQGQVTISAVPYFFNEQLTQAAITAKCHLVDMGGNTDLVLKQLTYSQEAQQAGVTIIPDMGLAPGYANLLAAELIEGFDVVESVQIRVGGLPQAPQPPLNYQLLFSIEGLINEYLGDCVVLRDGKRETVPSLSDLETLEFPEPVGRCEAFTTLGGLSTLPWTYEGKIKHLDYKTVRYPGHCAQIRLLEDLGFFSMQPIRTREGMLVSPRQVSSAVLDQVLRHENPRDYVVIRVTVQGQKAGQHSTAQFECLDAYDPTSQLTAMMRTTAFPVSIVAQWLGAGKIQQAGVFPPERVMPVGLVRQEMEKRGIHTRIQHVNTSACS